MFFRTEVFWVPLMKGKYLAKTLFLLAWVWCKKVHIWEWIKNPKGPVISNLGSEWRLGGECERKWERQVEPMLGEADEMRSGASAVWASEGFRSSPSLKDSRRHFVSEQCGSSMECSQGPTSVFWFCPH